MLYGAHPPCFHVCIMNKKADWYFNLFCLLVFLASILYGYYK